MEEDLQSQKLKKKLAVANASELVNSQISDSYGQDSQRKHPSDTDSQVICAPRHPQIFTGSDSSSIRISPADDALNIFYTAQCEELRSDFAAKLAGTPSLVASHESSDSECEYSSNDEDSGVNEPPNISYDLMKWAKKHMVPFSLVDSLLKVLHSHHPTLPLSAKTLLKNPQAKKHVIQKLNSFNIGIQVEFVYTGIAEGLLKKVNPALHAEPELPLKMNVDGVTLYNSSSVEFWVTSVKVHTKKDYYKPFPVTVHCGAGKPDDLDAYFDPFVTEINTLIEIGIVIEGRKFCVKIMCFSCDRVARSFIKCIKGHGGFWVCEVCIVKAIRPNNTTYYPVNCAPLRTDESFRNQDNPEYHHAVSPLVKIKDLDMIIDFMMEFMHQGCLGNMKKISLDHWFKISKHILTHEQILMVSQRLMNLSNQLPSEFQRSTRSLANKSLFKATEWRFLLQYGAPVIMKDILPDNYWKNFMLLHTGCMILDSESLCLVYLDEAEEYLNIFCETAVELYGEEISVINLHNTSHLARDVKNKNALLQLFQHSLLRIYSVR
ncbi:hypothetical protein QAD02_002360 [Eretmocerus hayati]|uniref:Uncharacterized protein n=1 Tax=Eretmocerus hayati TaxID=131215 RepID=A0ACC2NJL1_9HYME|nr:hypothetical protein QAD02_002360 [Eretmocerus hayati]